MDTIKIIAPALLLCAGVFLFPARADISPTSEPFPGIRYHTESRTTPPTRLVVAEIDLKNPKIHVRVSRGGADPDGAGKWETTLLPPTDVATRDHLALVVNGDFFQVKEVKDAEGVKSPYKTGQWAAVIGDAVTDGKTWSKSSTPRPCLVVRKNRKVTIETLAQPSADAWEIIGGNTLLVKDGVDVAPPPSPQTHAYPQHPRTVVGLDAAGTKLILLVVDGRQPGVAAGMNYEELAQEMLRLGCAQALNLDGGGSSVMAVRDPASGEMKILNQPSDGHERPVADTLGISVDR